MAWTKDDARAASRRWRERNPEQAKEWREANPGRATEITRAYAARNPEKRKAHVMLNNAIRDGKIERPTRCAWCGDEPTPNAAGRSRIEAHHENYTEPFEVTWLCKPCHKAYHRKVGA